MSWHGELGSFGDERRDKGGAATSGATKGARCSRGAGLDRQTCCLRKLGGGRAGEVRYGRFLRNAGVTKEEMLRTAAAPPGSSRAAAAISWPGRKQYMTDWSSSTRSGEAGPWQKMCDFFRAE
jgi:hypothetical protein